jgi:hypothetical protein
VHLFGKTGLDAGNDVDRQFDNPLLDATEYLWKSVAEVFRIHYFGSSHGEKFLSAW